MESTTGLRALVVEDDPAERWLMAEILRSRGHEVTVCRTTKAGWERYRKEPYALVFLDWTPPSVDGLALCREIRRHPRGDWTVVVIVTARDESSDLQEVLDAGADDYVSKPIDVGLMHVRVRLAEKESEEIARRKEDQAALEAKTRRLKRANEELKAFAYTVSHDLRAPLRTMEGFAHALLADFGDELSPEAEDYVHRIIGSGRQSEELISDLLDYSRLSLEEVSLAPVELDRVVENALERLAGDLESRGATVHVDHPLPTVRGHGPTLVQVVANLISNAVKFVEEDVAPRVEITAERDGARVRLFVEDNGVGISTDQQDRVFRMFERLVHDGDRPGTGIGLAIVRRGMERMGGTAGVTSDGSSGSRFWIELPGGRAVDDTNEAGVDPPGPP